MKKKQYKKPKTTTRVQYHDTRGQRHARNTLPRAAERHANDPIVDAQAAIITIIPTIIIIIIIPTIISSSNTIIITTEPNTDTIDDSEDDDEHLFPIADETQQTKEEESSQQVRSLFILRTMTTTTFDTEMATIWTNVLDMEVNNDVAVALIGHTKIKSLVNKKSDVHIDINIGNSILIEELYKRSLLIRNNFFDLYVNIIKQCLYRCFM